MAEIRLIDTSLRDGNQCLWAALGIDTAKCLTVAPLQAQYHAEGDASAFLALAVTELPVQLQRLLQVDVGLTEPAALPEGFETPLGELEVSWDADSATLAQFPPVFGPVMMRRLKPRPNRSQRP